LVLHTCIYNFNQIPPFVAISLLISSTEVFFALLSQESNTTLKIGMRLHVSLVRGLGCWLLQKCSILLFINEID
jgi:hypothetical protein